MPILSNYNWDVFESVINIDNHESFDTHDIIWRRDIAVIDIHGEGKLMRDGGNARSTDVTLKALLHFNYFRTWPITSTSEVGELDRQSLVALFNIQYLRDLGYINANNNFDFKPDTDRMIINGIIHKIMGWTDVALGQDDALTLQVVLKREETPTGSNQL